VGSWKITYTNGIVRVYTFEKAGKMSGTAEAISQLVANKKMPSK
jgi:hypothetical protein